VDLPLNLNKDTVVIILTVSKLSYFVSKLTVTPICHFVLIGILFEILRKIVKSLKNLNMTTGKINVSVENIFPLIKKFL
jgi:hypothetical protein